MSHLFHSTQCPQGLPRWLIGKEPACQCRSSRRRRFDPWVRRTPWRRKWQPAPVILPGESHGPRSLAGYSPQEAKSWTRLKQLSTHIHTVRIFYKTCEKINKNSIAKYNWIPTWTMLETLETGFEECWCLE